jgi:hypothetical protein
MMTEKQLQEIDEHYLKFRIFGYTFRWFSTSPMHIYRHVQRVKNRSISGVVGQSEQLICEHCNKYKRTQGNGVIHKLCECGV